MSIIFSIRVAPCLFILLCAAAAAAPLALLEVTGAGQGGKDTSCPQCYRTVIDLNTFSTEELQQAMQAGLRYDGVWMIPENSPQVDNATWTQAIETLGVYYQGCLVSEEYGVGATVCPVVRALAGGVLTSSFQYHETGFVPGGTLLSDDEVSQYASKCGAPVIALTRGWNEPEWQEKTNAILGNPSLQGIAWEFIPGDPTDPELSQMANWINGMQDSNKQAILLLAFGVCCSEYPSLERALAAHINLLRASGARLDSPNVWFVITRYIDQPPYHTPVLGSTNSVQAITNTLMACRNSDAKC